MRIFDEPGLVTYCSNEVNSSAILADLINRKGVSTIRLKGDPFIDRFDNVAMLVNYCQSQHITVLIEIGLVNHWLSNYIPSGWKTILCLNKKPDFIEADFTLYKVE